MGFGHRVYKNFDPRANVMRKTCHEVLKHLKLHNDKTFPIALELEKIALNDEYFIKRKLYPNVDFYSGIVLRALGIPTTCLRPFLPSPAQSGGCRTGMNSTKTRVSHRPPAPVVFGRQETKIKIVGEKIR